MYETKLELDIRQRHGEPDLILTPDSDTVSSQKPSDDIAYEYWLYLSESCADGCIVYARYERGWVCNPSARWPMAEMARRILEK